MKLSDVTLSFPILNYRMRITHFSARVSTAIEWVILEAINKIEQTPDTEYSKYSIDLFFSQIFLIGMEGDSNLLIKPCLFSLMDRNAIYTEYDLSDDTDLRDVPISALKLTEQGRSMQNKGLLPGEDSEAKYSVLYDLMNKELKRNRDKESYSDKEAGLVICDNKENLKNTPLPASQVKDFLYALQKNQQTAPAWLQPDTEIKDIVLDSDSKEPPVSVLWSNKRYSLSCNKDMRVAIGNIQNSSVLDAVLDDLGNKDSRESIDASKIPNVEIQNVDNELKDISTIDEMDKSLVDLIDNNQVFFINNEIINFDIDNIIKDETNKICFIFAGQNFSIESNKNLILRMPEEIGKIRSNALFGCKAESFYLGRFNLKSETTAKDVCLCYSPKEQKEDVASIIRFVLEKYLSERNFDLIYLFLLINEKDTFLATLNSVLSTRTSYKEKLSMIDQVCKKTSQFALPVNLSKDSLYLEQIKWNYGGKNEAVEILKIINDIRDDYRFKENSAFLERVLIKIFSNWKTCSELGDLWSVLEKCKIDRSILGWLKNNIYVNRLFSDDILFQIVRHYSDKDFIRIPVYTKFEEILIAFKRNLEEINNSIKPQSIPSELAREDLKNTILMSRLDLKRLTECVKKHRDLVLSMNAYLTERKKIVQDTSIASTRSLLQDEFFARTENEINVIDDAVLELHNKGVKM